MTAEEIVVGKKYVYQLAPEINAVAQVIFERRVDGVRYLRYTINGVKQAGYGKDGDFARAVLGEYFPV